jgi:hypothetical protein
MTIYSQLLVKSRPDIRPMLQEFERRKYRRKTLLKLAISSLLLVWMAVQVAAGQTSTPQSEPFLVRISDVQVSMTPTAGPNTVGNCMVVYPGGRSYLELRRQEFFYGSASIVGYEGKLSAQELTYLRAILDSAAVKSLQPFPMPTLPMHSDDF